MVEPLGTWRPIRAPLDHVCWLRNLSVMRGSPSQARSQLPMGRAPSDRQSADLRTAQLILAEGLSTGMSGVNSPSRKSTCALSTVTSPIQVLIVQSHTYCELVSNRPRKECKRAVVREFHVS